MKKETGKDGFQSDVVKRLKKEFEGCIILKNDPNYRQGVPDILVLYEDKWAALEVKRDQNARHRPNQDYYIRKMNDMSYAAFVHPDNFEEVFDGLQKTFRS